MLLYAHHYAVFWAYGGALFIVNITRGIVFLFVGIGAVLLLRNPSFCTFVCFRRTLCFFLYDYICCRL